MPSRHVLPLASFILQPPILGLWLTGSLLTWAMLEAPVREVPYLLVLAPFLLYVIALVSYGFEVVEQTALGYREAPPFWRSFRNEDIRLLRELFAVALAWSVLRITPEAWQFLPVMIILFVTPAVTSSIAFHVPLVTALNPVRIWQFISNMGLSYVSLRILMTSVLLLSLYVAEGELELLATEEGRMFVAAGLIYLVLMMFRATGALLHIRRNELGIETVFSDEQLEAQMRAAQADGLRRDLKRVQRMVSRASSRETRDAAWMQLEGRIRSQPAERVHLYYEVLKEFSDRYLLYQVASRLIGKLLPDDPAGARRVFDEMTAESEKFRLHSGSLLLSLCQGPVSRAQMVSLHRMLSRFERDFPGHPRRNEAAATAAKFARELGLSGGEGIELVS